MERENRAPLTHRPLRGGGVPLGDVVGGVPVETPFGEAWVVETPLDEVAGREGFSATFVACIESPDSPLGRSHRRKPLTADALVFLDLETCGLWNAPLFLVGTLVWREGALCVRQFFARGYDEEAALLALWEQTVRDKRLLLSFNGKSFDVPFLRSRALFHGFPPLPEPPHLDLLHESRRVWRNRVPNHQLQTLERFLCARTREDDIASRDIPQAYDRYVRTGDTAPIARILRHNALDLFTVAELLLRLHYAERSS